MDSKQLREHVLNRLGHGASKWHAARYDELGFDAFVAEQLAGTLEEIEYLDATAEAKLDRAALSKRQLEVGLLDFWFNHFNVDASGRIVRDHLQVYQDEVIRPHVLGSFATMLAASAESIAMLYYLDNRLNYEEEIVNGREFGLNENYARELLELHTMGVDSGYTEDDIINVARILTGWSFNGAREFVFRIGRHDHGAKTVLGVDFPSGRRKEEGDELLAMLAAQNATAGFISYKLCRRYVNETPPQSVVDAATATFVQTNGDLREVTRTILTSSEFADGANFRAKVKPPVRYIASALAAVGAESLADFAAIRDDLVAGIKAIGEEPYYVAPPTGYPESSGYWTSGASMLERFQIAGVIAADPTLRLKLRSRANTGGNVSTITVDRIASVLCPGGVSDSTRAAAVTFAERSPQGDERVTAATQMILSSPEFVRF